MAASSFPVIQLLIVSADGHLAKRLKRHLYGQPAARQARYRVRYAANRAEFFSRLADSLADSIVTAESGLPGLPLRDVLAAARESGAGIPVIVVGEAGQQRPSMRLLRRGAVEYLGAGELHQLPLIMGQLLRSQREKGREMPLQHQALSGVGRTQEDQRLISIGRLVGSIAHEINNPLESVTNLLFLIEREPGLPAAVHGYLTMAQTELGRAIQISKQTLNFYRESPEPISTQLSTLLEEVLVLYRRRIEAKGLELTRQYRGDEPVMVFPGAMRQIFSNLISNAIEASSEKGKLCLRIRKSRLWRDSGVTGLRVIVGDTGAGMSPEVRRRAGEPLFTTKGQEGTGLGLWVTRSIIRGYGGELLLRSSTGRNHGSVFTVFLPTNLRPRRLLTGSDARNGIVSMQTATPKDGVTPRMA